VHVRVGLGAALVGVLVAFWAWVTSIAADNDPLDGAVWVVHGTYTGTLWEAGTRSPFLTADQTVIGEVNPHPGGADLQTAVYEATLDETHCEPGRSYWSPA
jgi:hypothetical protein